MMLFIVSFLIGALLSYGGIGILSKPVLFFAIIVAILYYAHLYKKNN